ncbi:MAG TPA: hypothetical protein VFZ61_25505 [Polyangiales bacterium]
MIVHDAPHVTSTFLPEIPCVLQTWHGHASSPEFRDATLRVLQFLKERQREFPRVEFLVDGRKLGALVAEDMEWAAKVADPQLYAVGMRRIAFVLPERAVGRTSVRSYQTAASRGPERMLISETFRDVVSAKRWLKQQV